MTNSETTFYVIYSHVKEVNEHFEKVHVSGSGADTVFRNQSLGWYIGFEGSHESLYFGKTRPELNTGDRVRITFESITDAKSSATSK